MIDLSSPYRGLRVMVTGGLGFIGSTLAMRLADVGSQVCVVDSLIPKYGGNLFNVLGYEGRMRINIADVRDRHGMDYLVRDQDVIFNLAGQTSHLDSMEDPETDLEINCRAQLSLLEACRRNNPEVKIVFASTRQIYGQPKYLPVDEDHPLAPVDVNGVNKLSGESFHMLYNNVYGMRAVVLRLTNTYGPRMRVKDARQTFLGIWIRRIIEGQPIQVFGDGRQLRDFTYVDDVVDAFLEAGVTEGANGRIYNLGGDRVLTLRELAQQLVGIAGSGSYELQPFPGALKRIDIGDYYASGVRIAKELGWQPRTPLECGLARTLAYYRNHHSHYW